MLPKAFSLISTTVSLVTCVAGQGYDYGLDINTLAKREVQDPFVVSGMSRVNNVTLNRPEIRELQGDDDRWSLYILALSMMQYTDQSQQFSWYQIAGKPETVHSKPMMTTADT